MNHTMKASVWIIVGATASVILLGILLYLVWINRASDKSLPLLFKVMAPLLLSCAWLIHEIFIVPAPETVQEVPVIVIFDRDLNIASLSFPLAMVGATQADGYNTLLMNSFDNQEFAKTLDKSKPDALDDEMNFMTDLMEKVLWVWLSSHYNIHWLVERSVFRGIGGWGGGTGIPKTAEKNPRVIRREDLFAILHDNKAISEKCMIGTLALPAGSQLTTERDRHRRLIRIETSSAVIKIELLLCGGGRENPKDNILASFFHKQFRTGSNWNDINFNVRFTFRARKDRRWAPSTRDQRAWFDSTAQMFREAFDWNQTRIALEKFIQLQAVTGFAETANKSIEAIK